MVWWFAAPLVVWGAKKIYDAVTEDDTYSHSSETSKSISCAKSKRTKEREKKLVKMILQNRELLISKSSLECGIIKKIVEADITIFNLSFDLINNELRNLTDLANEIGINPTSRFNAETKEIIVFGALDDITGNLLDYADKEYGDWAGIDQYNEYTEYQDPFMCKLNAL